MLLGSDCLLQKADYIESLLNDSVRAKGLNLLPNTKLQASQPVLRARAVKPTECLRGQSPSFSIQITLKNAF